MRRALLLTLLYSGALLGAPAPSLELQELRLNVEQIAYQLRSHQTERDLFLERIEKLEKGLELLGQQLRQGRGSEGRLAQLEKGHELLLADCKSLKNHLNETNTLLASCQTRLSQIDKQLASEVQGLKKSLESMLSLLQAEGNSPSGENSRCYIVKPGDSLGKIAMMHRTDTKTLKQRNALSSDTIYIGQKLLVPEAPPTKK